MWYEKLTKKELIYTLITRDFIIDNNRREVEMLKKALKLAREYMFNVMCADNVPSEEWFIECAKNNTKPC